MDFVGRNGLSEGNPITTGSFYLVEEKKPDYSYELFNDTVSGDIPGLVITRDYPPDVLKKYSLELCNVHWLTHLVGENHINPTALGLLLSRINSFIESNERLVVLLDGVEYLISQNGFERILHFLHQIRDMILTHGGTMIMPLDIRVVDRKERAFLERNLEVIEPEESRMKGRRLHFELDNGLLKVLKEEDR